MNDRYKQFMVMLLLFGFAITTTAQVAQIFVPENNPESDIKPKIKIEDNQLFAITSSGVYSQEIKESGDLADETLLPSNLLKNLEYNVKNLVVNKDVAIVTTTNYFQDKNSILKTEDGGISWTDLNNWEGLGFAEYYNRTSGIHRGKISDPNELIAFVGQHIYYSSDFGENWEKKGVLLYSYPKIHPHDPGIIICCMMSWTDQIANEDFYCTYDYGQNWSYIYIPEILGFYAISDVAYHYSDPNRIVLIAETIVTSSDLGKTWEETKSWGYDNEHLFILNSDFDTRGGDRLYGTRDNILLYSDDFGANWTELCSVGEDASDYIYDFVQKEDKLYAITHSFKVYQIDLSQLETSIDSIPADNNIATLSVAGDVLKVNSETEILEIEVYNIGGVKLLSQKYATEGIDVSVLEKGTYIGRLRTANGDVSSIKFNK